MWISLISLLRNWARIGNKCPPLMEKQYRVLFSRITRATSSPPSTLGISRTSEAKFGRPLAPGWNDRPGWADHPHRARIGSHPDLGLALLRSLHIFGEGGNGAR